MSRAYRITVKESSTRQLKGADEISTTLEVLEILPPEQMAELLKRELKQRGYTEQPDGTYAKQDGNITVTIDAKTCEVTVKAQVGEEVTVEAKRETTGYDDVGPGQKEIRERVKEQLQHDLEQKAGKEAERLQTEATADLEKKLCDLQPELSEVVNKVTREALKQKAAQLGNIKEISEDSQSGELTIKVEV